MSIRAIGTKRMTYGEAWRQTFILMGDPSSQIAAAMGGWDHPVERLDLVMRDLYDLQHAKATAGSKKQSKPYPRPWPETKARRQAPNADVTQRQILEALRSAGHDGPLPSSLN